MKVVVQRVSQASVSVDGKTVVTIKHGFVLLVGIGKEDTEGSVRKMAQKIVGLRICSDAEGKMNLSLHEVKGEILAIPQFTLYAQLKGQNRPFFGGAAKPQSAKSLFELFINELRKLGVQRVESGTFGAYMQVSLINDGPVTLVIDSSEI